jgi:hypothetical protein
MLLMSRRRTGANVRRLMRRLMGAGRNSHFSLLGFQAGGWP